MKYKKCNKYKKKLASVYDAHKNNNKNNDKRVIGIAQLCLSAELKINMSTFLLFRDAFLLILNWPHLLNIHTLGIDDPGTHRITLAASVNTGIELSLPFCQHKGSCTTALPPRFRTHCL